MPRIRVLLFLLSILLVPIVCQVPVINIGRTASRAGPGSAFIRGQDRGWEMFIDLVNKTGGVTVNGTKYQFKQTSYNDGSDVELANILYERLITVDNVTFLSAPYTTPLVRAAAAIANKYQIPMINHNTAFSSSLKAMLMNPWTFHIVPQADGVVESCGEIFVQKKIKTAVVAFSVGSESRAAGVNVSFAAINISVLATDTLPPSADIKARKALINKWKSLKPDMWVGQYTEDTLASADLLLQMRHEKFTPSAFYHYVMPNTPAFRQAASWAGVYGFGSSLWDPDMNFPDPIFNNSKDFAAEYIRRYNLSLSGLEPSAAAAGVMYWYAVQAANSLNHDAVRQALVSAPLSFYRSLSHSRHPGVNDCFPAGERRLRHALRSDSVQS
jgi:branched-chain amino acid transport system substrate-binding protein